MSWLSEIEDLELRLSVEELTRTTPDSIPVIQRLIAYYAEKLSILHGERERKRAKIDHHAVDLQDAVSISDISVQLPARKKYTLVLSSKILVLRNPKTEETDFSYTLEDMQLVVCVPSPGATKGDTFALFSKQAGMDPVVFNIPHKAPNPLVIKRTGDQADEILTESGQKRDRLLSLLSANGQIPTSRPCRKAFQTTIESSKTGKPVVGMMEEDGNTIRCYANTYLKAKEGCLYFLPQGILYGFKKPAIFFPLDSISSTYFCNIMQHTFNLVLVLKENHSPLGSAISDKTIEFSLIEQSEYTGIDSYIQACGINDSSMSEEKMAPISKKALSTTAAAVAGTAVATASAATFNDDDDEEDDLDFKPSDEEDDPLEYDSEAGDSSGDEAQQDALIGEDQEQDDAEVIEDGEEVDEEDLEKESAGEDEEEDEDTFAQEEDVADASDEEERDITRTDNETDDQDLIAEDEEEVDMADEDEEEDDARSESLGSSSDQDIDEDMHDASIPDDRKEEKDELDDSD
ncbi:Rtt106-domain-containing protein [Lichtheimia hyalospora FSU 10163]|nr:Rtt106-domain-containing protein [Lichtheimia hyalospora FSU 10163]